MLKNRLLLGPDVIVSDLWDVYGHRFSNSMDQPGKVVNPARGQLNREK